jgi:hypothetical protein
MKKLYLLVVVLCIGLFCFVNLYSSSGQPSQERLASTTTITYNIPYFNNHSGYYTIDVPGSKTNSDEFTLRIMDDKGRLITTISPSLLDAQIEKMKELASRLEGRDTKYLQRVEGGIDILQKTKEALQDPDKILAALAKFKSSGTDPKSNSIQSVPWSYTFNTIRNVYFSMGGTIY